MLDDYFDGIGERDWEHPTVDGTVRFAVVGAGWWTREEAIPAIRESEYCETTVVADISDEAVSEVVATADEVEHGLTAEEFVDGVAADAYDAVYVCTPNSTHLDYVSASAELGKPVLCEKPMEASLERARQLADVCTEYDVPLMIAYRMQTEPLVRRAKELVAEGTIGDVVQLHSDISATLLDIIPDPDQWRLDPEIAGGCTLIDLGIYPLNTIRFILEETPETVYGTTRQSHDAFADVDESVWFELQFSGDTGALCTASHRAHGTSNLRIIGRDGVLELRELYHPWADRELVVEVGDTRAQVTTDNVNQMTEEFDYFAHCLLTGTDPSPDGQHGLRDMEIIDSIYRSADVGEPQSTR